MKTFITTILCGLFLISSYAFAKDLKPHAAQTDAEKALENILQVNIDKSRDLKKFIYNYPTRDKSKDSELKQLFTVRLIKAYSKYYDDFPSEPDGSKYIDADNLTCSQDGPKTSASEYKFYTVKTDANKEFILLYWPLTNENINILQPVSNLENLYIMQKSKDGNWQLDGVQCFPDMKFNVK